MAVTIVIMIAIPLIFIFVFWLPNYRSIMKRARKIDPNVKTIAEAQYVLQKIYGICRQTQIGRRK